MPTGRSLCLMLGCGLISALAVGCGGRSPDYGSLGLVEAHGRVTLNGQPLSGGYVTFASPEGSMSTATTDSNGDYRLRLNSEQSGVTPGPKTVRIYSQEPAEGEELPVGEGGESADRVPAKYNSDSTLKITVEPGKSQTFDFDL